jgi:hypothetical protein
MTENSLINIINTINKINIFDILLNKINIYSNKIYKIYNDNEEQIQTDFIKAIYIKYKLLSEEINYDNHFYNLLPFMKFTNINTIKHLLHWGCDNDEYMLCEYILLHKNIIIPNSEYQLLEIKAVELNKDFVFLFTQHRINDSNDSSFSNSSDEDNYDYKKVKDIN